MGFNAQAERPTEGRPIDEALRVLSKPPARPKLLRLDALRGLAVLLVFVYHLAGQSMGWPREYVDGVRHFDLWLGSSDWLLYPVMLGWAGVPIFFVLSGFVIHLAFRSYERDGITQFYRRRFWRVYPPYALAVLAFVVVNPRPYEHLGTQLVSHLLLVHNFHPSTLEGVNSSFWTIAVESQFYLLYPLFMLMRGRLGIGRTVIALAVVNVAGRAIVTALAGGADVLPDAWANVILKSPLILWFDWALGAYVAECFVEKRRAFGSTIARVGLATCAIGSVAATMFEGTAPFAFSVISIGAALVIDRIAHGTLEPRWFERALVPLGLVGYSFYLLHQPMLNELTRRFARLGLDGFAAPIAWVLTFAVIFVASWLMYRFVERPSQAMGKPRARQPEPAHADVIAGRSDSLGAASTNREAFIGTRI